MLPANKLNSCWFVQWSSLSSWLCLLQSLLYAISLQACASLGHEVYYRLMGNLMWEPSLKQSNTSLLHREASELCDDQQLLLLRQTAMEYKMKLNGMVQVITEIIIVHMLNNLRGVHWVTERKVSFFNLSLMFSKCL